MTSRLIYTAVIQSINLENLTKYAAPSPRGSIKPEATQLTRLDPGSHLIPEGEPTHEQTHNLAPAGRPYGSRGWAASTKTPASRCVMIKSHRDGHTATKNKNVKHVKTFPEAIHSRLVLIHLDCNFCLSLYGRPYGTWLLCRLSPGLRSWRCYTPGYHTAIPNGIWSSFYFFFILRICYGFELMGGQFSRP